MTEVSVLVLGDSQVGKSRLLYGEPGLVQACNATFQTKKMYLFAENINFRLMSLSGKWKVEQIPEAYWQKKYDMIYVMFDLTNKASFDNVRSYIKAIKRGNKKASILMIATKHDDREHRVVSEADIKCTTKKFNCECIETSAVNKKNLHELFVKTREVVLENRAREKVGGEAGFLKRCSRKIILFTLAVLNWAKKFIYRKRNTNEADAPAAELSSTGQIAQEIGFVPAEQADEKPHLLNELDVPEVIVREASPSLQAAFSALSRMR